MAYIYPIDMNTKDSHQTNPGYLLTIIRWSNRDTYNYKKPTEIGNMRIGNLAVRKPLVIYNDALSVTVNVSKSVLTPSLSALLLAGDINYSTAIAPGDFVLCNIVNNENEIHGTAKDKRSGLRNRAAGGEQAINRYNDGFKGIFKIQSCRRKIITNEQTGVKTVAYELKAFGFTEFNSKIYYNPQIYNNLSKEYALYVTQFDTFWSDIVSGKDMLEVQKVIKLLINALIGKGLKQPVTLLDVPEIQVYKIPQTVGNLLGVKGAKSASHIFNYVFGIWNSTKPTNQLNMYKGFNLGLKDEGSGFYSTNVNLQGKRQMSPEYWNNVTVWSIISNSSNSVINEMYTTYRVNKDGKVMPTIIARQKPFTPEHTAMTSNVTKFLSLPRWKISPNMIYSLSLGREEAARINFVQVYTRSVTVEGSENVAIQTGKGNYVEDIDDIQRNGLKPLVATADFDWDSKSKDTEKGVEWSRLVSEWVFLGHLKEAGTIQCVGIEEPISVGDNLELDGIVYHIESVQHTISMTSGGIKKFRTNLTVSFGTDKRSNKDRPVYPEMDYTDAHSNRVDDHNHEKILPGYSDAQDIVGRIDGEELTETKEKSFTLDPKPKEKPEGKADGTSNKVSVNKNAYDLSDYLKK